MTTVPTPQKILILAANPRHTVPLRLNEELRDIRDGLQRSPNGDKFDLRYDLAVRPRDIRRAILDYRPNIIHFSGHGTGVKGLCFEDETGQEQLVTGEALAGLFAQFSKHLGCVMLNACYAELQAEAIVKYINYAIGMNDSIDDKAAIEFAIGFYDALAGYNPQYDEGSPVEFAFKVARSSIALAGVSGEFIPVLKAKPNLTKFEDEANIGSVKETSMQYSGRVKITVCQRLVNDWELLADYFDIPHQQKTSFERGKEPNRVWEWLNQRNKLDELEAALNDIGRGDLVELLKKK